MKIESDTQNCVRILNENGVDTDNANAVVRMLREMEIYNIYTKDEVNEMLTEGMKEVSKNVDKVLEQYRRESDLMFKKVDEDLREAKVMRRWVVTTISVVGLGLAALIYHLH